MTRQRFSWLLPEGWRWMMWWCPRHKAYHPLKILHFLRFQYDH